MSFQPCNNVTTSFPNNTASHLPLQRTQHDGQEVAAVIKQPLSHSCSYLDLLQHVFQLNQELLGIFSFVRDAVQRLGELALQTHKEKRHQSKASHLCGCLLLVCPLITGLPVQTGITHSAGQLPPFTCNKLVMFNLSDCRACSGIKQQGSLVCCGGSWFKSTCLCGVHSPRLQIINFSLHNRRSS